MSAMFRTLRPFLLTLVCIWSGLSIAANIYAHKLPASSHWIMTGILPAFLLESTFFAAAGFEQTRELFARIPARWIQSLLLMTSALVPFLIVTITGGTFDSHAFLILAALCGLMSFWWVLFPNRTAYDIAWLIVAAAPIVLKVFSRLYVSPVKQDISILGHIMWIRIALTGLLVQRQFELGPISFWPKGHEWREGLLQFWASIVPLSVLAMLIRFAVFTPKKYSPGLWMAVAVGQFFGILWVVAFSEDIFRSVITRLFFRFKQPVVVAVAGSAILVGCAHLWYKDFPNWRFALVAAGAHFFYTLAYVRSGSVRASMVTHALTVTTWRMLFISP